MCIRDRAYLVKQLEGSRYALPLRGLLFALALWLVAWNGWLYTTYLV